MESQRRNEAGEERQSSPTIKIEGVIINKVQGGTIYGQIALNKLRKQRKDFRERKAMGEGRTKSESANKKYVGKFLWGQKTEPILK